MGRPKLNKETTNRYSVECGTVDKLEQLASNMGYRYGTGAAMGKFLEMIADLDPILLVRIKGLSVITNQNEILSNQSNLTQDML
jgi:hypothetical protein